MVAASSLSRAFRSQSVAAWLTGADLCSWLPSSVTPSVYREVCKLRRHEGSPSRGPHICTCTCCNGRSARGLRHCRTTERQAGQCTSAEPKST